MLVLVGEFCAFGCSVAGGEGDCRPPLGVCGAAAAIWRATEGRRRATDVDLLGLALGCDSSMGCRQDGVLGLDWPFGDGVLAGPGLPLIGVGSSVSRRASRRFREDHATPHIAPPERRREAACCSQPRSLQPCCASPAIQRPRGYDGKKSGANRQKSCPPSCSGESFVARGSASGYDCKRLQGQIVGSLFQPGYSNDPALREPAKNSDSHLLTPDRAGEGHLLSEKGVTAILLGPQGT